MFIGFSLPWWVVPAAIAAISLTVPGPGTKWGRYGLYIAAFLVAGHYFTRWLG